MNLRHMALGVALCCGSPSACARFGVHSAHLNRMQVISIANHAAAEEGADLSRYKEPEVYFEYVKKDWTWAVFYDGIQPGFGSHFTVIVDDRTGHAAVEGGL
jgi:DNA-binding transcriptional regulator YdaS (Cro superfamily)